jgi:3-hydroxymyristoyl/3-hydroxydecanoyl-(acyl carrier protein) dehydratase
MGRKIRKEVLVSLAIEAMLQRVEVAGGWSEIASEEKLRELLGLQNE